MSYKQGAQKGDSLSINKFERFYCRNLNLIELHGLQCVAQNGG